MTNYPNDPNQPDFGGEKPQDGSGYPQYGAPQGGQYGAPQEGGQYGNPPQGGQYGAQPYGSPQYGAPQPGSPYGGAPASAGEHSKATLIMVLGIVSIVCCGLFTGIPAIIMGRQAMAEIDSSGGAVGGRGKVKAGFICGIIGTVWSILGLIVRLAVH